MEREDERATGCAPASVPRCDQTLERLISERAAELRASEERFRSIVESTPMGIHLYRLDADGRLVLTGANPAADRILGIDHARLVGLTIEEAFPNLAGTEVPLRYRRACATGQPWESQQVDYEDEQVRGAFEVHAFGTGAGTMAVLFLEVTARKDTEAALRESEEKYRLLVENAGDGIFIAQDGILKFANRRAAEMVGYLSEDEVNGRGFTDFIAPEDREMVRDRHVRRLRGEPIPTTYDLRLRRKDGTVFWANLNAVVLAWEGRPASLNFIRDISEVKRMEEALRQAERMKAVGTLAGGIAHDFNNILMAVQGNVELLLLEAGPGHPFHDRLKNIAHGVESGGALTRQILGFARGGRYQVVALDLNDLVARSALLFGRTRKEIAIHTDLAGDLRAIEGDQTQLEQVLLNLFVNAWQSMPAGGTLHLATENVTLDGGRAAVLGVRPGRYARLAVRDTGCGMDEATRLRVFEPFFTTKELGRGTGLGLASAYGIVKSHGGSIQAESELGRGTVFTVLLPATDKPVTAVSPGSHGHTTGSGCVLLVDDEPAVFATAAALLERLGYRVLGARGGEEAVALLGARRGEVAAVVLDMVMPGMSGGETFDRLRAIDPAVKVLLSSGYSEDGQAREILARGCDGFIQKPYTLAALSAKLAKLLGGSA